MLSLLRFGVKAGLMSSAVYVTIDYGVWKDSNTSLKLFEKLSTETSTVIAPLIEKVPISLPDVPKTGSLISTAENTWNMGVLATCRFLAASPTCAKHYLDQGYQYVKVQTVNLLESSEQKST